MLETIPIYRMTLQPESYLLEANQGKLIIDLICELPNSENVHRKKELNLLPIEKHEPYYNARLLLETKRFIREMLYCCSIKMEEYETILRSNNLQALFALIESFRFAFFKYLILKDIDAYKLFTGHMEAEVKAASSVEDIQRHVRKYGVMSRLYKKVNADYQVLKSMYC